MKRILKYSALITVSLLFISLLPLAPSGITDKVDKIFVEWDRPDSPGCALAVIQNGRIVYERGYGLANLEHNIPISPDSVFYVGSVSKQFVAMCTALLAHEGKCNLDCDIRTFVPELPDYGTPITIRHLIHHTSGLRDYLELESIIGVPFGLYHEDEVIELISRQKELNFKPGDEYLYSNSGYFLQALIVKRASGTSLREFAEKRIFKPLGMDSSQFHDDYMRLIKKRASGYFFAGKGSFRNSVSTFDCVGSGGLYTSVRDLYLWDQNFYHKKVGGKEALDLMHTAGTLNSGKQIDYAFGLVVGSYKGLKTVSHGGALEGYRSAIIRFPEQSFSVICLSNLSSFNPSKACYDVAEIYLSDKLRGGEKPEKEAPPVASLNLPKAVLKDKIGTYINLKVGRVMKIILRGAKLYLETSGQMLPLEARSENEFYALNTPAPLSLKFEKQKGGRQMILHITPEGEKPETYEAHELVPPTTEQLREYTGDFYSSELQVTYSVALKDGKLHFTTKNSPQEPLIPSLPDLFTVRGIKIIFLRDGESKVFAFKMDTGRVRNLEFIKK